MTSDRPDTLGTIATEARAVCIGDDVRFGYGDAGHPFDPDRRGQCRKQAGGYCDGTRADPQHDRRAPGLVSGA